LPSRSAQRFGPGPEDERLRAALAADWADRHRLAGLLRDQDRLARDEWQLHGQLTTQIDQLLRDVDSEARAELRRSWPTPVPVVARLSRRRGR
jgi:tRNA A37 threonylcarbamoyladenosine synthetase subunit TsaC/SUA5/YrdC